jgi:hypothetical protein
MPLDALKSRHCSSPPELVKVEDQQVGANQADAQQVATDQVEEESMNVTLNHPRAVALGTILEE